MIIKLLGSVHREGTSKSSGKKYSFDVLYVAYTDPFVHGEKAQELVVSPEVTSPLILTPGTLYNVDIDLRGKVCGMSVHTPPASPADRGGLFTGKGSK